MALYKYTQLFPDGTEQSFTVERQLGYKELQKLVGGRLELIPHDYYADNEWGKCTVFGYEEARLDSQPRNKHFQVLKDHLGNAWDVVGVCVREEKLKEEKGSAKK